MALFLKSQATMPNQKNRRVALNICTFSGRMARDPEVRNVGQNTVLSFTIANDVGYGDKKTTNWVRCSYWNHDKIAQYLHKGDQVTVSGEISMREYNGKTSLELRVFDLVLPPRPRDGNPSAQAPAHQEQTDVTPF